MIISASLYKFEIISIQAEMSNEVPTIGEKKKNEIVIDEI